MLKGLRVKELALVEEAELDFEPNFNVLTGETGTGKTVLVSALKLLLGGKKTHSVVRTGANKAVIEGVFILDEGQRKALAEIAGENLEELVLVREISREGKDKLYLNGRLVPLSIGSQIAQHLIQLYGQNEHHALLKKTSHLEYLDSFAGTPLKEIKTLFLQNFKEWEDLRKKLEEKQRLAESKKEKEEFLKFQLEEIKKVALAEGEEEKLREEREILRYQEKIAASLNRILELFLGEKNNIINLLGQALKEAEKISNLGNQLQRIETFLRELIEKGNDLTGAVESFLNSFSFEPGRLEEVEERLYQISILKRKYGESITEILKRQSQLEEELALLERVSFDLSDLSKKEEVVRERVKELGLQLSEFRRKSAFKLEEKLAQILPLLGFKGCSVEVEIKQQMPNDSLENISSEGFDQVELFFRPGAGEEKKPLKDIASGGELSRLMLALRTVHPDFVATRTAVFDEVDAGIGGVTAQKVGHHLSDLSSKSQVLCVTHLPQIASLANCHFLVEKEEKGGRSVTRVKKLSFEERVREVARLLGGTTSQKAIEHAREILNKEKGVSQRL